MQPQGPDSDHIKIIVNWVVGVFGQNAVCEALRVDAETLEAVLTGSLEASAGFRERLSRLIETADAAGLGRPPAMPDVPNTGPEVVSPGPGDLEVPSTPRTSGDHPVQKSGPARQPPVPSSPSPREALEREAEDRECLTLRRLYEELREFEKSESLSCWRRLSVQVAQVKVLLLIAIVHHDNPLIKWSQSISREVKIARLRKKLRALQSELSTWPGGLLNWFKSNGPGTAKDIIRQVSTKKLFPKLAVEPFLLARILKMGEE